MLEARAPDQARRLALTMRMPVQDSHVRSRSSGATLIEEDDPIFLWVEEAPVLWIGSASGSAYHARDLGHKEFVKFREREN